MPPLETPPPFMAIAILNFHFDYWHTSLTLNVVWMVSNHYKNAIFIQFSFLSCFQFWWIFVSIFGGFYFQGSLGVNFTSVRILHALLKPPWTGTSPAKVSITKATCWASHLLMFSFLMYCCIVLHYNS